MKTNPGHWPSYRVRARWDGTLESPSYWVGLWERGGRDEYIRTRLSFDRSNPFIYQTAERMCMVVNNDTARHYFAEFNRNYLYRDLRSAQRDHYTSQDRERRAAEWRAGEADRIVQRNRAVEEVQRRAAEATHRAHELLTSIVNDKFLAGIESGVPFYHSTVYNKYIIDPVHKNVIRLDESG